MARRDPTLAPHEALSLFALSMLLLLGLGPLLVANLGLGGSALSQLFFIAAPAIALAWARAGPRAWHHHLGLRPARPWALVGAVLVGASFWFLNLVLVVPLTERWLGGAEDLRELERIILPPGQPLWVPLFAVVLLPAVCEEILFRGALARALAGRLGMVGAVAVSALLFGGFHILPARIPPTAVFGVVLAYGTLASGSLLPGIVMHLANNAITILLVTDNLEPLAVAIAQHPELTGAIAIVMSATGLALFASPKEPGSS